MINDQRIFFAFPKFNRKIEHFKYNFHMYQNNEKNLYVNCKTIIV